MNTINIKRRYYHLWKILSIFIYFSSNFILISSQETGDYIDENRTINPSLFPPVLKVTFMIMTDQIKLI